MKHPHFKEKVSVWTKLRFILKVVRDIFFRKRSKALYYFYSRRPFFQDCYLCGAVHGLVMEDPDADRSDCMNCYRSRQEETEIPPIILDGIKAKFADEDEDWTKV